MLFILIPIVWLAVLSLLVAVCRVAADGDAQLASQAQTKAAGSPIGLKLTLSRTSSPHGIRARRTYAAGSPARPAASTRLRRATAHAGRWH